MVVIRDRESSSRLAIEAYELPGQLRTKRRNVRGQRLLDKNHEGHETGIGESNQEIENPFLSA
jgi:hypothetical protein